MPMAIDWSDDSGGPYDDSSGGTHGFILASLLSTPNYQQIDEPKANEYTVDATGAVNGFLATLTASGK
jgi:hypothetical protein